MPLVDERTGETYFRASVALSEAVVGDGYFQRRLQAGMTVVAEMATGEKTLLSYMLKPVQLTVARAFRGRKNETTGASKNCHDVAYQRASG